MDGVELDYHLPADELSPFVTLFYRFRVPAPAFDDVERAQSPQLRWRLSPGGASYHFCDGTRADAPPAHVLGPTTGPSRTCVAGPVFVFGLGLTPAGWAALMGSDASAMADRVVCAAALFGEAVSEAAIPLRADGGVAAMAASVAPLLRRLFASRRDPAIFAFVRAVDAWLAGSPSPCLDALVAATGLCRRQVERRCNALYGAPPKLLARKYRALRAAVQLASGETEADGFYDQSHMIREVKQFTGLTPRRLRDARGELARLTIAQRRALGGLVHPTVSET